MRKLKSERYAGKNTIQIKSDLHRYSRSFHGAVYSGQAKETPNRTRTEFYSKAEKRTQSKHGKEKLESGL